MIFTSQTKIFIDFGSSASAPGGAVWLQSITDAEVNSDKSVEVLATIGVEGGAGWRTKTGGGTIMLTELRQAKPQVLWRLLEKNKTEFMIMAQDENAGPREKWLPCRISKVERSMDAEGKHTDKIEIKFLRGYESA